MKRDTPIAALLGVNADLTCRRPISFGPLPETLLRQMNTDAHTIPLTQFYTQSGAMIDGQRNGPAAAGDA